VLIRSRGRLPHWEKDAGLYFVTFRLADSLPQSVWERLERERQRIEALSSSGKLTKAEQRELQRSQHRKFETSLDAGHGSCVLRNEAVASVVAKALEFWEGKRYRLLCWCVMPNHVHVVLRLLPGQELAAVLHSWKSFSAKQINKTIGRTGTVWQREYYDHLIRDGKELDKTIAYVLNNPTRAKLRNWKWVTLCGQDARTTAGGTPALPTE
jgi:type I restriction enzyme R subunit